MENVESMENMENVEVSASISDLSRKGCCERSREFKKNFGAVNDSTQGQAYYRNRVLIDTIKYALFYNFRKKEDIYKYLETRYPEIGYENEIQYRVNLAWDKFYVMRYLDAEKRKGLRPSEIQVTIEGMRYKVAVDAMFVSGISKDTVELVKFKTGRASSTNSFDREENFSCTLCCWQEKRWGMRT